MSIGRHSLIVVVIQICLDVSLLNWLAFALSDCARADLRLRRLTTGKTQANKCFVVRASPSVSFCELTQQLLEGSEGSISHSLVTTPAKIIPMDHTNTTSRDHDPTLLLALLLSLLPLGSADNKWPI